MNSVSAERVFKDNFGGIFVDSVYSTMAPSLTACVFMHRVTFGLIGGRWCWG